MTKPKVLAISLAIFAVLAVISIRALTQPKVVGDRAAAGLTKESIENGSTNGTSTVNGPNHAENSIVGSSDQIENGPAIQEVVTDLDIPWDIVFLPSGNLLVTQRPGSVLHIQSETQTAIPVSGVEHFGEGGLLGIVLHPEYETNKYVYLYLTTRTESGLQNRVERYVFNERNSSLNNRTVILEDIPGAIYHDGGKLAFGPDGHLYITTGDAGNANSAQDTNSLAGKILRLTDTGEIPEDNPFNNEVYSFGHRNPQGIAWDSTGRMWSTEHGPSGISSGFDEINLITKGNNYGWPTVRGAQTRSGMHSPVIQSGSEDTWAPAGMAIHDNTVFFAGLRGESLYSAKISGSELTDFTQHFTGEFGRLRAVVVDPTQRWLYISTSNQDGRGTAQENDDKIIRIRLDALLEVANGS